MIWKTECDNCKAVVAVEMKNPPLQAIKFEFEAECPLCGSTQEYRFKK